MAITMRAIVFFLAGGRGRYTFVGCRLAVGEKIMCNKTSSSPRMGTQESAASSHSDDGRLG